MKKYYLKKGLLVIGFSILSFGTLLAQNTNEYFESFTEGSKTFTSNNVDFTLTNVLKLTSLSQAGVDANTPASTSGNSNKYIDNLGSGAKNQTNSIKTTNGSLFTAKQLYYYLSTVDNNSNTPSSDGSIEFKGKVSGNVVFTISKSTGFNTSFNPYSGFNFLDFSQFANTNIDELEFTIGGNFVYVAIDNFTFGPSAPSISEIGTLNSFSTCQGSASSTQTFLVNGSNLSNDITLSAPSGVEISTSPSSNFNNSLTLTQSNGTVSSTIIYVRLTGTTATSIAGNIIISSTNAATVNVAVGGTVKTMPSVTSTSGASRCDAGTVTLGATGSRLNIPVGVTLNWYTVSTSGTSLGTGNSYTTPSISTTTTYYVDATLNGCTSARSAVVATVNNTPIKPTVNNVAQCGGGIYTLNASSPDRQNGAISNVYSWYTDSSSNVVINTGNSYTTPALSQSTTYWVSNTLNGCESAKSPATAIYKPKPGAPMSQSLERCGIGPFQIIAQGAPIRSQNVINFEYDWYDMNNNLVQSGDTLKTDTISTIYSEAKFKLTSTLDGCVSDTSIIYLWTKPVPINPVVTDVNLCGPNTTTLLASSVINRIANPNCRGNCGTFITYNWFNDLAGNDLIINNNGTLVTDSIFSYTTFYVQAENDLGCTSEIVPINVDITSINLSVSQNGNTLTSDQGKGATYQWIDCDNNGAIINGETARDFSPMTSGNYAVIVSLNNCTDTSACHAFNITGINNDVSSQVSVYPNPAKDLVKVSLPNSTEGTASILNTTGEEIISQSVNGSNVELNTSTLASGVYFVKINSSNLSVTKQIVIVK